MTGLTEQPDIETRIVDSVSDEERQRLTGWGENVFGVPEHPMEWRPTDKHVMLYADGELMTHVGVVGHIIRVGEQPVVVGGIGGVVTVGAAHGRGYATTALRAACEYMRERLHANFGLLFCFDKLVPFYERLGWQLINVPVAVEQPSGPTQMPLNTMVLPLGEQQWPPGPVELDSLPW